MARGKGEGSLYKQSDGLWAAYVTLPTGPDGKTRRKVVRSKDKPVVVKKLRELKRDLAKHGDLPTTDMKFEQWATYWLNTICAPTVRPNTFNGYKSAVNNYLIPAFGKKKLTHITAPKVREMLDWIQTLPKSPKIRALPESERPENYTRLGPDTAISAHGTLNRIMEAAKQEGRITYNVMDVVDRPSKKVVVQRALTPQEALRLLAFISTRSDAALWATYLLTGARRGEVIGLERDRVGDNLDLSWQLIRITDISKAPKDYEYRKQRGSLYLTRPKSSRGWRVLPLIEPLKSFLDLHMQSCGDGLLFTDEEGRALDPDTVSRTWRAILQEAKLPEDVTLHGARHTVVDLLFDAGISDTVIQDIVGHSTRAMTHQYRTRGNPELVKAALTGMVEKMNSAGALD